MNVKILVISVMILNRIKPMTAKNTDFFMRIGKIKRMSRIRMICSKMFEIVFGTIRCRPKKYPFRMDEILIKGRVPVIAMSK